MHSTAFEDRAHLLASCLPFSILRCQAGQWELAVALFDKLSGSDLAPDVPIFNSMIAACAHGGGFARARALFDAMPAHGCQPDAVTFANLIRAYKKGGQWCVCFRCPASSSHH